MPTTRLESLCLEGSLGKIQDLTGMKFGRLLVLNREYTGNKNPKWRCLCDCGEECITTGSSLRAGDSKSCGCLRKELLTKHGMCGTITYTSWFKMVARVTGDYEDPVNYKYYKDKSVCEEWTGEDGFLNFLRDMGERPSKEFTIDRIDSNLGYFKENCRWADKATQARNTNSDGMNGINWSKTKNKWIVTIGVDGTTKYVGITEDLDKAKLMRKQAEEIYWNGN